MACRSLLPASRCWKTGRITTMILLGGRPLCRPVACARSRPPRRSRNRSPRLLRRPRSDEFLDVFAKQIRFEIHGIADFALAQCRDRVSVRDNPDAEAWFAN